MGNIKSVIDRINIQGSPISSFKRRFVEYKTKGIGNNPFYDDCDCYSGDCSDCVCTDCNESWDPD